MITSDPNIQGGEPCIAGTRLPVHCLVTFHRHGYKPRAIQREYPFVTLRQIGAAIRWQRDQESRRRYDRERFRPTF